MELSDAISRIKDAIDVSAATQSDGPWITAVREAGLVAGEDVGHPGIDQTYTGEIEGAAVQVQYTWRDASRTMEMRPDRTRIRLEVRHADNRVETYANGYER